MSARFLLWSVLLFVGLSIALLSGCSDAPDFNAEVRPILNQHCLPCHGGVKQESGLSLLTRELALAPTESGSAVIVPGHATRSAFYQRLIEGDPQRRMPLDKEPLSAQEISIIKKWLDSGARWDLHWSYKPVEEPMLPVLQAGGAPTATDQAIDLFVVDKLQSLGISSLSAEADRQALLRRASLDLLGLPAPEALTEAFLREEGAVSFEQLVDSLLDRPEYGERWTSMWLDLARYADSKGFERDPHRDIWRYRDWLIRRFNEDMPYDQFIIEQLAGDLLPNATDDQLVATAFHRNTSTNDEGGTDNEEFRNYAVIDRVNTTWQGLMSTTFACVQCHSHTYDPFLHDEYYRFFAFFNNTRDADTHPDYPLLRHLIEDDSVRLAGLMGWAEMYTTPEEVADMSRFIKTWQPAWYSIEMDSFDQSELYDTKYLGMRQQGRSRLAGVKLTGSDVLYMRYRTGLTGGRLQVHTGSGELVLSTELPVTGGPWRIASFDIKSVSAGHRDLYWSYENPNLKNPTEPGAMFDWLSIRPATDLWNQPDGAAFERDFWHLLTARRETTPVMIENPPYMRRETYLFERGNWLVPGERVTPGVPSVLPPMKAMGEPTRLDLARWITSTENPLTARTIVNRIWAQLFGRGIVETLEDMGSQGAAPTHPELLDYLSWHFVHTHHWSIKSFLRSVMLSATYRQRAHASEELLQSDPDARYLSRFPRVRLTGEQMRDQALAVSGLLNRQMYGPSVMPYQPVQWSVPYAGPDEKWIVSTDGQQHRRSVYTYWKRTSPYPAMMIMDAAAREVCEVQRVHTNTPLHALVGLNDPVYAEAASHLALRMFRSTPDVRAQIAQGYRWCTGRRITNELEQLLMAVFDQTMGAIKAGEAETGALLSHLPEGPGGQQAELASLMLVANTMLNLDECLVKS